MAWKSEVIADSSGKWCGNMCVFATQEEADNYVKDLMWRWTAVRETRTVETDDSVNYKWTPDGAEKIEEQLDSAELEDQARQIRKFSPPVDTDREPNPDGSAL